MKGTKESVPRVDSLVALMHHAQSDLGLICLEKETKTCFWISEFKLGIS